NGRFQSGPGLGHPGWRSSMKRRAPPRPVTKSASKYCGRRRNENQNSKKERHEANELEAEISGETGSAHGNQSGRGTAALQDLTEFRLLWKARSVLECGCPSAAIQYFYWLFVISAFRANYLVHPTSLIRANLYLTFNS